MRYINTYNKYKNIKNNEGIRSSIAKAIVTGGLMLSSPTQTELFNEPNKYTVGSVLSKLDNIEDNILEISNIRKNEESKDTVLSNILSNIETSIKSGDTSSYKEMFNNLSSHINKEYNYTIKEVDIDNDEIPNYNDMKKMSLMDIIGWLGSICLAICGLPQAVQSFKDKHSEGISWGFILLWGFGEIFALAYVYDKLDLPLLMNYSVNLLIMGIIFYFKIKPSKSIE